MKILIYSSQVLKLCFRIFQLWIKPDVFVHAELLIGLLAECILFVLRLQQLILLLNCVVRYQQLLDFRIHKLQGSLVLAYHIHVHWLLVASFCWCHLTRWCRLMQFPERWVVQVQGRHIFIFDKWLWLFGRLLLWYILLVNNIERFLLLVQIRFRRVSHRPFQPFVLKGALEHCLLLLGAFISIGIRVGRGNELLHAHQVLLIDRRLRIDLVLTLIMW